MHPNDGRVVSNFIVQAPGGEPFTVYGKVARRAPFLLYIERHRRRFARLMASDDEFAGPANLGDPHECTVLGLAELIVQMTVPLREGLRKTIEYFERLLSSRVTALPRVAGATG
jgi:UDP-glucuronate decarboxylase